MVDASETNLLPKFLTAGIASFCVNKVLQLILHPGFDVPEGFVNKNNGCHIVVIVPSMKNDRATNSPDYPNYAIEPHVLYELSWGKSNWDEKKLDEIARCKALQLWHGRNDERTDVMPHLLFPGDTRYWGGVKRHGIVTACSGFHQGIDQMMSGMIIEMIVGVVYEIYIHSKDYEENLQFLT